MTRPRLPSIEPLAPDHRGPGLRPGVDPDDVRRRICDHTLLMLLVLAARADAGDARSVEPGLAGSRPQPCRCLCRGFSQITITRPCRRITLHLSQIFLTLGWTFIELLSELSVGQAGS